MRKTKIKIPIFHGELTIIQTKKWSEITKKYGKSDLDFYFLVVWRDEKSNYLSLYVVFKNKPKVGVIAHEVVHLVNHIFISKGIQLDTYNDETQAYLTGWIVEQIHKHIK